MANKKEYNPNENNGIVRILPTDWARMYEIAKELDVKGGVQEVFEAIVATLGYRNGMPDDQIRLAVKMHKLQRRLK